MSSDERKRPFSSVDSDIFTKSKKPLHELSESGPLTQDDVVFFKKEAMWRQMRYYKLQAESLQLDLSKYERRYQTFVAAHELLESWYAQVLKACDVSEIDSLDLSVASTELEEFLNARTAKLAGLLKSASFDVSQLQDALKLESELSASQKIQEELRDKLLDVQHELATLQKLKDREGSATLQRIHRNSHAVKEEDDTHSNGKHSKNGASENGSAQSSEAVTISSAEKDELERLRIEVGELQAAVSSSKEMLETMSAKLTGAETDAESLRLRLSNLTEEDLSKSPKFIELATQNKSLQESLNQTSHFQQELVNKVKALEEKDGNYSKVVNKELEEENARLKENLSRSENDLARIRAIRDELLAKQTILTSEIENKKTNAELYKLNKVLNDRLTHLEKTKDEVSVEKNSSLQSLEREELIKRLQILSAETKEIEAAFQQTRSITLDKMKEATDNEGLIKKLSVEKNKADQKYFASMRLKDSLSNENKVLKSQIAKSQEMVAKFNEIEKTYVSKIEILTKSVNDYKVIKEMSISENSQLQKTSKMLGKTREVVSKELTEAKEQVASLKKQVGDLSSEVQSKTMAHNKLDARLRATESLLQKYKQNNTSSILEEDEKQLEALRSITKCSVCSKNWKNTAITACGHVFCDGCVHERLAARLRRCPTCNKGFSSNDLLSIHL